MVQPSRVLTRGRIVALSLIAVLVGALVYVRLASGTESVSVPEGAKAGDLFLQSCNYATENGSYEADCGTLVVPENRSNPRSRLIALPVTRIRALSERRQEPVFYLEGGPGITNTKFKQASRFAVDRDVVLIGYRGVDGSVRLDCLEVDSALKQSADFLSDKSFRAYGDAFRRCAVRLTEEGFDLTSYGLPNQVDDFEAARVAFGYDRINLLSQSAGTRTALIYAWRYPERIHRSVMIGVNPPGHLLWDPKTMDEQLDRYGELCAKDSSCSKRTDSLTESMRRTAANMPNRWMFLPIKESNVKIFTFYGLMESTSDAGLLSASITLDSWLSSADGDASGFWLQSLFGDLFPIPFVWGQYASAARLDARAAGAYFASTGSEHEANLGYVGTAFAWGGGRLVEGWPSAPDEDAYSRVKVSEVETLLIGGALDTSTPPQVATRELLPYLPNGHEVVLPGFGHTASFFAEQPEAGAKLVNTFFDSGRVDDSLYRPQRIDFTPGVTLTAYAKVIAGAMTVLVLLALASLVLMARQVYKHGGFGGKVSIALRSAYPVVLGLGGLSFGALVVMTISAPIRLDGRLLVALSIGMPVGFGIFWAWVHRDWSAQTKITGLVAAVGGAILGAWLGHNATTGLLVIVATILGAAACANLFLIAHDITRELSDRRQIAAATIPPGSTRTIAG